MSINSPQTDLALRRYELIVELLAENIDRGRRASLLKCASEKAHVSTRTIQRWIAAYKQGGLEGLMPSTHHPGISNSSVSDDIVDYAIMLRREVPQRSVIDIIRLMELEGFIKEGQVKRSTLQDHLERRGFGRRQIGYYVNGSSGAARRFERQHRNELWQADIKYLFMLPASDGKPKRQIYASAFIDDATRFVTGLRVYEHQNVNSVLDCFLHAIESYGIPQEVYVDNGRQYTSKGLRQVCGKLGIHLMHTKPYAAESKGKVEAFNKFLDKFVEEAKVTSMKRIEDVQRALASWLEVWYQQKPHSSLSGNLSPREAFVQDTRAINRASAQMLLEGFTTTQERIVDKTGCLSFGSQLWEAGEMYIGLKVKVHHSLYTPDTLIISHAMFEDKEIHPLQITSFCRGRRKPIVFTKATRSRVLDATAQHYEETMSPVGATSFANFQEEGK